MRHGIRLSISLSIAALIASLVLSASTWANDESVLAVEQLGGVVAVQRDGQRLPLKVGDALQEQDLILTERSGRLTLRFARHGFLDIGPGAEIGVERMPFALYAKDLKSVFSVAKGYLRVVWKHPQISTNWPLYIYMAGHRISLTSGEYFFQNEGSEQRACTAAGQIALQAVGADSVETVKPPACTRLVAGVPPQTASRDPDDWIAVRQGFDIRSDASQLAQASRQPEPPPLSAPPPPRPSVIATSAVAASPSFAAPTPIPPPAAREAFDPLGEEPALRTSSASVGPVVAAPILPTPSPAPATSIIALPEPPRATLPPAIATVNYPPPAAVRRQPVAVPDPVVPLRAAPVPYAPAMGAGNWALNVASYADSSAAEKQVEQLRAAGYPAGVQPATVNGKAWHRVQVQGYGSQQAAKAAAVELKTRLGLQGIWVVRPG